MVPENIHTPTTEALEILRGGGVLKAKIFKGKYEPKLEFPEEWGFKPKKPSVEGVWIFSGTTQFWKAVTHKRQTFTTESKFHFRYILITTSLPYLGAYMETFNWIDVSNGVQQTLNKSVVEFLLDWGQVHQNNVFFFVREALFQDSLTPSTEAMGRTWVMTLEGRRGMGGDKGKGKMGWERGSVNLPLPSCLSPNSYPLSAKQSSRDLDIQVSIFFLTVLQAQFFSK